MNRLDGMVARDLLRRSCRQRAAKRLGWAFGLLLLGLGAMPFPVWGILPSEKAPVQLELPERPAPAAVATRRAPGLESSEAGRWNLRWDPWSGAAAVGFRGTPAPRHGRIDASGAIAAAEEFRARHAGLLGTVGMALARVRSEHLGRAWYVTWQQKHGGHDVFACTLTLVLSESGSPIAFRSTLVPGLRALPAAPSLARDAVQTASARAGEALTIESSRPLVLALPADGTYAAVAAEGLELRGAYGGRWTALADAASGELLALESRVRTFRVDGTAHADILPRYAHDTPEARALQWLDVSLASGSSIFDATSNVAGEYAFDVPTSGACTVASNLSGLYVHVVNQAGDPPAYASTPATAPGTATLHFGDAEARLDERTIYYHTNVVHDYAKATFGLTLLDYPMRATASVVNPVTGNHDYANAYWDGMGINFGNGGGFYQNFGLFADVIYHEYVHGITDFMYQAGGGLGGMEGGAIHEALSDYFACTLTDEPLVGEYLSGGGSYFRNLDNALRWPDNAVGEVHGDGEILGGALWDLRELVGPQVADAVIHFARTLYPRTFEDYATAVHLQDDILFGDGAPANGSPHRDEIATAFALHGIGDGAARTRQLVHEPLGDTEDANVPRRVEAAFDLGISTPQDSVLLQWSAGGSFQAVRMLRQLDGRFVGEIPGQPEGADVHYWITTKPRRGQPTLVLPPGAPGTTFAYHIGVDTQPPVVAHVPRASAASCSWPAEVTVEIEDNLGVANAYVAYRRNGEAGSYLGLVRTAGTRTRYTAQFPNVGILGDEIEYWIVVRDAARAGNTTRLPASGGYRFQIVGTSSEDFESGGPWSHRNIVVTHNDAWHVSDAVNHTPGGSRAWWCGTDGGEYPTIVAAELVTDTYSLGHGAHASVWSRVDAETNGPFEAFDAGVVQIQVDGEPAWQVLVPEGGYSHRMSDTGGTNVLPAGTPCLSGRDADWRALQFDLASWSRKRVRFRFLFASDNIPSVGGNLQGWKLDDFTLDPGVQDPTDAEEPGDVAGRGLLLRPPGPNPARTYVAFDLGVPAQAGHVRLDLFDVRGRRVRRLVDDALPGGRRDVVWDGRGDAGDRLPAGVYGYRLEWRSGTESGRLVLLH